jgi:ribonuclease R
VAVADVGHYVKPGTALDIEAYERGTSCYFPHRVLPMLPERLSNGLCSLNPDEDRLVMVAEMDFDASGKKQRQKVYEAVFRSQHRCVYETLQQFYDRPNDTGHEYNPRVRESLLALFDLYKKLLQSRIRRGAIDLNLPEAKVKVNRETGDVEGIVRTERLDTHRLIEEFMIAANEAVSEIMEQHKQAFIFRVHETPEEEATKRFLDVARSLHVRINEKWLEDITPITYQKILRAIEENPASRVLNFLLLRSMKQAYYTAENLKHFGLASTAYTHFTSPIRRYPDLIVHRLLKAWLHKSKKEAQAAKGSVAANLEEAAQHCSMRERAAVDAEREFIRIKQVRYAERHLGEEHSGVVVGINAKGAYVELADVFIEGFIPLERFGADFVFNEKLYHLRGKRTGKIIQIGDKLDAQIVRTNPHLLQIELEPLQGKAKKPKPTPEKIQHKPPEARDFWTLEDFE